MSVFKKNHHQLFSLLFHSHHQAVWQIIFSHDLPIMHEEFYFLKSSHHCSDAQNYHFFVLVLFLLHLLWASKETYFALICLIAVLLWFSQGDLSLYRGCAVGSTFFFCISCRCILSSVSVDTTSFWGYLVI